MTADRLSAEDWHVLRQEAGPVRGHSGKILVLEKSGDRPLPDVTRLRAMIVARLDLAPRLRQRLAGARFGLARPVWADDLGFDICRHVAAVPARGPVSRAELERIAAGLMATRLDRSRPLWQLDVVEALDDGAMALIWRLHHCLADGATAMRFGAAVLWNAAADTPPAEPPQWVAQPGPSPAGLLTMAMRDLARSLLRHPGRPSVAAVLRSRSVLARELSRTAALTPLARRVGPNRSVALARAPLLECKQAGKAIGAGVTVNDVVLAIVAGGLRQWLQARGDRLEGIRVKVPVSLHRSAERAPVANRDSYFFVDLPVAEPDLAARVLAISAQTQERKLGQDADTLHEFGLAPLVARWAMSPRVFTVNVSNVAGPADPVYVAGARVREMYSLAEIAQGHALRIAVISCAGTLFFGLLADSDAVTDLHVLADGIDKAVGELVGLATPATVPGAAAAA